MLKRSLAALGMAVVISAAGTAAATAAALTIRYTGLYVYESGSRLVGEIDYTTNANNLFQRINNDPNGDRMHVQAPVRDRSVTNGHAVYPQVDWAKNGTYCYVSGIGPDSGSVSCGSGWNGYGSTRGQDMFDSNWWFYSFDKPYDFSSNSIRAALKICEDIPWSTDPCSGKRYGGISY